MATPAPHPRAYLTFLLVTRAAAWLRLSQREEAWKTAEILILRHQLAILQRRQPRRPKLNWADRALIATLVGILTTSIPAPSSTASNALVNCPARSRTRNRTRAARSGCRVRGPTACRRGWSGADPAS